MKREPTEPQASIKATGVGIPRLQAWEEVKLIGAPRHDGYRQPSTIWLKNSICEFDNMRSCDIIEYVFNRNNHDKSRHADLHEFNSCDIIELVERTG